METPGDSLLPAVLTVVVAAGVAASMLVMSWLLGRPKRSRVDTTPYECGIVPIEPLEGRRFSVKFYLVAMLFVIFDIEAVFLFAWAIVIPDVGWTGFWGAAVFILILLAGLLYDSRTGALDWAPESSSGRPRSPAG